MIVGITGRKRAGKDTAAQYLVDKYGFIRMGYADVLKEAVANLLDIHPDDVDMFKDNPQIRCGIFNPTRTDNQHSHRYTMRQFLQRFGREMGRNTFGQSFWVDQLQDRLESNKNYVIPDVRFDNETIPCDCIIEIVRPGMGFDPHASEQGLRDELIDFIVLNNGTIEDLHSRVEQCLAETLSSASLSN